MGIDSELTKETIRKRMLDWRGGLDDKEWSRRSNTICEHLLEECTLTGRRVMLFAAKNREVNLALLLEEPPEGTEFCLPVTNTDAGTLDVYRLEHPPHLRRSLEQSRPEDSIVRGAHGILEPSTSANQRIEPSDLDVVIVPGLAFDGQGNRIGYGEGYYDRFLSGLGDSTVSLGVCFDEQLFSDRLPVSDHDVPVERVVTDRRMK